MSRPLVSIVVPTYNRAGFVETAIMSLLEQDYPALEVIVVDDGSQDDTPALLERIAEHSDSERFRWFRQENAGQAKAINRGFTEARGELLGYLSSDDCLLPGAVSRLVLATEEHPGADVFYQSFHVIDEADRVTDTVECLQHTFVDALRWALCIPGVGTLVRRACYERIGGWDPDFHFVPDYEWWLRAGDVAFIRVPEPGGAWRAHEGSITMGRFDVEDVRARLRERFRMLDAVFAQADLATDVRAVEREAYATTLIEMGLLLNEDGIGDPSRRFAVEDRLVERFSRRAAETLPTARLWSERNARYADQRATAAEYVNGQLQQMLDAQRETVAEREQQAALLTAELERLQTEVADAAAARAAIAKHEARPRWLRVARELTPLPLRDRAGAALHRARKMARS